MSMKRTLALILTVGAIMVGCGRDGGQAPTALLTVDPVSIAASAADNLALQITREADLTWAGDATVTVMASVETGANWLTVDFASGVFGPMDTVPLVLTLDPTGLAAGTHTATVTFTPGDGSPPAVIAVAFHIPPPPPPSALLVSPGLARMHSLEGSGISTEATLAVQLRRGTDVEWLASSPESWLTLDLPPDDTLSDGESAEVGVGVDSAALAGLAKGLHSAEVTFSTPGGEALPVTVLVTLAVRPASAGAGEFVEFVSGIDLTTQVYGLKLPSTFDPLDTITRHPVAVRLHGYDGIPFIPGLMDKANDARMIQVGVHGRGNLQYDGPGETEIFEVLADLDGAYRIDRDFVIIEGFSMGATGAFRQFARHPGVFSAGGGADGWTDYKYWHSKHYAPSDDIHHVELSRLPSLFRASPLSYAENMDPARFWLGVSTSDASVWPMNGLKLESRLQRMDPGFAAYKVSGGHGASNAVTARFDYLVAAGPQEADPDAIAVRANSLRTAKRRWLAVERAIWPGFMEVSASRAIDGETVTYTVGVRNVEEFTIATPPEDPTVTRCIVKLHDRYADAADAVTAVDTAAPVFPMTVSIDTADDGRTVTGGALRAAAPDAGRKTSALEGPVIRSLSERFIVAYGSAFGPEDWRTERDLASARKFLDHWADVWNDGRYGFKAIWDRRDITGTLIFTNGSGTVTGSGASFLAELRADDLVKPASGSYAWYRVAEVVDDNQLKLAGSFYQSGYTGAARAAATLRPRDESALAEADLAGANLVIFGSEESSSLIDLMATSPETPFNLPVRVLEDQVVVDGMPYPIDFGNTAPQSHGAWFTCANPLAPSRLATIGHNVIGQGSPEGMYDVVFQGHDTWKWGWPDYIVFDTKASIRTEVDASEYYWADQYVDAATGWFDRDWRVSGSSDAATVIAFSGATVGLDDLEVTLDVFDESGAAITEALDESAFDIRIDGERVPVGVLNDEARVSQVALGQYDLLVPVGGLLASTGSGAGQAKYDLTVEIVRPTLAGPVRGEGRLVFVKP